MDERVGRRPNKTCLCQYKRRVARRIHSHFFLLAPVIFSSSPAKAKSGHPIPPAGRFSHRIPIEKNLSTHTPSAFACSSPFPSTLAGIRDPGRSYRPHASPAPSWPSGRKQDQPPHARACLMDDGNRGSRSPHISMFPPNMIAIAARICTDYPPLSSLIRISLEISSRISIFSARLM